MSIIITIALIQSLLIESPSSYIYTDLARQSVEDDFIFRSHVPVHLFTCEEKALKCEVRGCNNYVKKRHEFLHDRHYEQSHQERFSAVACLTRYVFLLLAYQLVRLMALGAVGWMDGGMNK